MVPPRRGDLNEDGWVDGRDVLPFAASWMQLNGGVGYRTAIDLDASGRVDAGDLLQLIEITHRVARKGQVPRPE